MKFLIPFFKISVLLVLSSCQWILLHPQVIPEAEAIAEEVVKDVENYEDHKSPS